MIQKGFFRVCFFNNLKRKIRTGHIGKQDTFDPPPPTPSPFRTCPKIHPFWSGDASLTFPYIQEAGGVHTLPQCRTVSHHQAGDLTIPDCNFSDLGREVAMFSVLRQGSCNNNVCGGRRASLADTCCCWYKVAVILSVSSQCHLPCNSATSSDWTPYTN